VSAPPDIVIYARSWCPYCVAAKELLTAKGASFREYDVEDEPRRLPEMIQRTQRRTVPQIFIGDKHVGGYDDLSALDRAGGLDTLLAGD
jgi:glutaredoxin 3